VSRTSLIVVMYHSRAHALMDHHLEHLEGTLDLAEAAAAPPS